MSILSGANAKIEHGKGLLNSFTNEVKEYFSATPYIINHKENNEGGLNFIFNYSKPIPSNWPMKIGDIIHNFKTSLDYMTFELVKLDGGDFTKNIYFPINRTNNNSNFEAKLKGIAGLSLNSQNFIRNIKPYKGGNEFLVRLHTLDISDKHKTLFLVAASNPQTEVNFAHVFGDMILPGMPKPNVSMMLKNANPQFPLKDGDIIGTILHKSNNIEHDLKSMRFEISICFGSEGRGQGT